MGATLPTKYDVISGFPRVQEVIMRIVLTILVVLWVVPSSKAEFIFDIQEAPHLPGAHEWHEHHAEFLPNMQKHPLFHHGHKLHEHHVFEGATSLVNKPEINWDPHLLHRIHHHFPFQTGHGTWFGAGSGPLLANGFGSGGTSPGGGSGGGSGGVGGEPGASIDSNSFGNHEGGGNSLPGGNGNGDHPIPGLGDGNGGVKTPIVNSVPPVPVHPAAVAMPEPSGILMLALGSLLVGGTWLLRFRFQVAT
jgi:hypothetical protein